jgi:hypothetical protein
MPTFTAGTTGLVGTVGVTIVNDTTGEVAVARSTAGITEPVTGSGVYWHAPVAAGLALVWDTGAGGLGAASDGTLHDFDPATDAITALAPIATTEQLDGLAHVDAAQDLSATNEAIAAVGDAVVAASTKGAGSVIAWPYRVVLDSNGDGIPDDPAVGIPGVAVWATSDAAGTSLLAGTHHTDDQGYVYFDLDPGTVYVWRRKARYTFPNPDTEVVS